MRRDLLFSWKFAEIFDRHIDPCSQAIRSCATMLLFMVPKRLYSRFDILLVMSECKVLRWSEISVEELEMHRPSFRTLLQAF